MLKLGLLLLKYFRPCDGRIAMLRQSHVCCLVKSALERHRSLPGHCKYSPLPDGMVKRVGLKFSGTNPELLPARTDGVSLKIFDDLG
jgi:hypothetical protein